MSAAGYPFREAHNVRFVQAEVNGVDVDRFAVHCRAGEDVPFDYLVLATGSENNYFGNPALAANTLSMKTVPQTQRLRNHVLACLEHWHAWSTPRRPTTTPSDAGRSRSS